jgi:hypothetical protein
VLLKFLCKKSFPGLTPTPGLALPRLHPVCWERAPLLGSRVEGGSDELSP